MAAAPARSNVIVAPARGYGAEFPHLTQHRFDHIAPQPSYWLATQIRRATAYRGRLTAVSMLLAIIAVSLAIPVSPIP